MCYKLHVYLYIPVYSHFRIDSSPNNDLYTASCNDDRLYKRMKCHVLDFLDVVNCNPFHLHILHIMLQSTISGEETMGQLLC